MIPTHEKIETIVLAYLADGTTEGAMGMLQPIRGIATGTYGVIADGKTVIVRSTAEGWRVQFKSVIVTDRDLLKAAKLALEAGAFVQVSKHIDLASELGLEE